MNLNDVIKVHIWQLPEKTNEVKKESEITMIHDGDTLKKVTLSKLYEYFNQDYKSENIIRYFDEIITSLNNEYSPKYSELELSLIDYERLVNELKEKFNVNRDNIRELQITSNQLDRDIEDLIIFEDINNNYSILLSNINDLFTIISNIKTMNTKHDKDIYSLGRVVNSLSTSIQNLENSHEEMVDRIITLNENEENSLSNFKETLIKNINTEYDKILAIIDYYHHIHDS